MKPWQQLWGGRAELPDTQLHSRVGGSKLTRLDSQTGTEQPGADVSVVRCLLFAAVQAPQRQQ